MPDHVDFSKLDPTKLDEYAKTDPIAKLVGEHLDKIPTIMTLRYFGRLTDAFLFITDLLDVYDVAKKQIVRRKTHGIAQMIRPYVTAKDPKGVIDFTVKAMEFKFEKQVQQYEPRLLNQGLVMLCTILDVFFEHVVEVIFKKEPKRLLDSEEARKVDLRSVIELGSTEAVMSDFIEKEVRRFGFQDTDRRLAYLERRCSLKTAAIFNWSQMKSAVQQQLKGWDGKTLRKIFDDRHSIVHGDKLPLTKRSELGNIKEFFDKIVFNMSYVAKKEHHLWTEFERLQETAALYEKLRNEKRGLTQVTP